MASDIHVAECACAPCEEKAQALSGWNVAKRTRHRIESLEAEIRDLFKQRHEWHAEERAKIIKQLREGKPFSVEYSKWAAHFADLLEQK